MTEAIDASGFGRFQLMMLLFTGLAWMGDAMEMMLLSFLGPSVRCEWVVSPTQEGRLTSVVFVGMLFGAPTWGVVADARAGDARFVATTIITFVAGLASAFSPSFGFLLFARTLVGFGLGGVPTASRSSKILPAVGRGKWLVAIEVFWTLGSVVEAGLAWAILPKHSWRVLCQPPPPRSRSCCASCGSSAGEPAAGPLRHVAIRRPPDPTEGQPRSREKRRLPRGVLKMPAAETSGGISVVEVETPRTRALQTPFKRFDGCRARVKKRWRVWRSDQRPRVGSRRALSAKNRTLTLMLWFVFFAVAFLYYGVVPLPTEIHVDGDSRGRMEGEASASPTARRALTRFARSARTARF